MISSKLLLIANGTSRRIPAARMAAATSPPSLINKAAANTLAQYYSDHTTAAKATTRYFSVASKKRKERKLKKQQQQKPQKETTKSASATAAASKPIVTHHQTKATATDESPPAVDDAELGVAAAPPGDDDYDEQLDDFESKMPMPDREKEKEISQMQQQVSQLYQQGFYQKGLPIAKELLQVCQDHFGKDLNMPHHPGTASSHVNVGLFYKQLGDFSNALEHYQKALKGYKKSVGTDHASYAAVLHNLGLLYQSQIHFDSDLKATDRLRLVEQALEYLQDAYAIRRAELPKEHPHTVATRTALGMTLTAHILHQHKRVSTSSSSSTTTTNSSGTSSGQQQGASNTDAGTSSYYVTLLPQQATESSWNAAQEHLQQALETALSNPRGDSCLKRNDKNHYLNIQKKNALKQKHNNGAKKSVEEMDNSPPPPLQTLSAATAAQNLGVFYKARATTTKNSDISMMREDWLAQAQDLYQKALSVREALLPKGHPDIYISQYSLAELYEYTHQMELANELRQTILDTYDPPTENTDEVKSDGGDGEGTGTADDGKK